MEEEKQLNVINAGVTEEEINLWKQKYGKVACIEVEDEDDLHVAYFHRPTLATMAAVTKMAKTDELKSSEVMYDNCFLGGSPAMRHDAILFIEATKQLGLLLSSCQSRLKNL